jgi:hypothetical protein
MLLALISSRALSPALGVEISASTRKRMWSGDHPGLQNRRAAGFPVAGGFDSHSLPPICSAKKRMDKKASRNSGTAARTSERD